MKRNRAILLIFGTLFLVYLYLYANEFEIRTTTEIWIIPIEMFIALIMFILLAILEVKWWLKLISLTVFAGVIIAGLPQIGLWKYSLVMVKE